MERGIRSINAAFIMGLLFSALLLDHALAGRDYYDILQIPKGADESQIKRAYRKLALKYHPDKVSGSKAEKESAAKKFADISSAYEALSDSEKRRIYDRYGEDGLREHEGRGGGGGAGARDIFSEFFGGFGGFGFGGGGQEEEEEMPKGNDILMELECTLRDLYLGHTFQITRDKNVIKPAKGKRQCNCRNKVVTRQLGPGMFQQYTTQECEECGNLQYVRQSETLTVSVEAGTPEKHVVTIFEEGEPLIDGEPGDLKFIVKSATDPKFVRQKDDLWYQQTISLEEALIGFSRQIEHLDGRKITIHKDAVTRPGEIQVVQGEGMPQFEDGHKNGNLYVNYTVKFPSKLTDQGKALVKQIAGMMTHDEL